MLSQNAERLPAEMLPAALLSWLFADLSREKDDWQAVKIPDKELWSLAFRQMLNAFEHEARASEKPESLSHLPKGKAFSSNPPALLLPIRKKLSPAQAAWQERYRRQALKTWLENLSEEERKNGCSALAKLLELHHFPTTQTALPWQKILRQQLRRTGRSRPEDSYRRLSKRYGRPPGLRLRFRQRLAVAVDTSGSVPEKLLGDFWREIKALQSNGAQITLLQFDDRIRRIIQLQGPPPRQWSGRGSTLYEPVIRWSQSHRPDALLIFTDGLGPRPLSSSLSPLLWLVAGPPRPHFEHWEGRFVFMNRDGWGETL